MLEGIPQENVTICKQILWQMFHNISEMNERRKTKKMNKTLFKSIREYRKQSLLAPILVILEVLMEVLIPLEMAKIIDIGIANGDLGYIVQRGIVLVAMAMLALFFGVQAGNMAAVAAAGYAKNLTP